MSKKEKKMALMGTLALVAGWFYMKKNKQKMNVSDAPSGAVSGSGAKAFFEEMGLWLDAGATGKEKREFLSQAFPDSVTKSDLEAYWSGKKIGEIPDYTAQDKQLIEDVVVWA